MEKVKDERSVKMETKKKINFKELSEEWLIYRKPRIKDSTYSAYKYVVIVRINKTLGKKTIEALQEYDFNSYVSELSNKYKPKTVRDTVVVLKQILRFAEKKYNLRYNLDLISIPRQQKTKIDVFNENECKKIEKFCTNSEKVMSIGVFISLETGLRVGEVCSLKWENINLSNRTISVKSTVQRIIADDESKKTKVIISTPKTKNSERDVPINDKLYKKLKELSFYYNKDIYVVSGEKERFIEPINYNEYFKRLLKKLKIRYRTYHNLRHTFATRCINVGMNAKELSLLLGHETIEITLNTYVHPSIEGTRKFLNKL